MVTKKTTRARGKTSGKTKLRRKSSCDFPCPNPDKKLSLEAIVRKMRRNPAFAEFISDLLCAAAKGDDKAQHCLDSYYDPTSVEVSALCLSKKLYKKTCTVPAKNLLIAVPAKGFARRGGK